MYALQECLKVINPAIGFVMLIMGLVVESSVHCLETPVWQQNVVRNALLFSMSVCAAVINFSKAVFETSYSSDGDGLAQQRQVGALSTC